MPPHSATAETEQGLISVTCGVLRTSICWRCRQLGFSARPSYLILGGLRTKMCQRWRRNSKLRAKGLGRPQPWQASTPICARCGGAAERNQRPRRGTDVVTEQCASQRGEQEDQGGDLPVDVAVCIAAVTPRAVNAFLLHLCAAIGNSWKFCIFQSFMSNTLRAAAHKRFTGTSLVCGQAGGQLSTQAETAHYPVVAKTNPLKYPILGDRR